MKKDSMVLGVETFKKIDVEGGDAWEHVVEELSTGLTQPHMHFAPVLRILTSLDQPLLAKASQPARSAHAIQLQLHSER